MTTNSDQRLSTTGGDTMTDDPDVEEVEEVEKDFKSSLLVAMLTKWMDDPFYLLQSPYPPGQGFWGGPTDAGVEIQDEDCNAVASITWSDLSGIFDEIENARVRAIFTVRDRHQDRIQRVK
jgi:hypothetical protein